jgi:6-pyruvoyltetrahydropterin/6-carboxytetrahydropterin synthase
MFTISKTFPFSASHVLRGLPDDHPCGRMHGHNYVIAVEVSGGVDEVGFVIDYGELAPVKRFIDDTLDHRHLNDVTWFPPGFNPTAEHLAYEVAHVLVRLVPRLAELRDAGRVRWRAGVSETPKTWAWCDPWVQWPPLSTATGRGPEHDAAAIMGLSSVQLNDG